jgi:acetyl-CoA carboxylase biotin carboxylase subunit
VPGSDGGLGTNDIENIELARNIGLPIIIKASGGGGGRGMQVVEKEENLLAAIELAKTEGLSFFGNAEVYMEKFLTTPRHVEIQILADEHGSAVHLGERDCSMQRRHQKVVEEAPAPGITPELRNKIGAVCADACKAINYRGAGTFEFLFENDEFYFIEMNTRIQVEHPVSEMVTGKDLIALQIASAAGENFKGMEDPEIRGHAIEFRINAEDYKHNFRPTPGKIDKLLFPGGFGVRVDTFIYEGYSVPSYYDSLLAKLIVWGESRQEAIRRGRRALSEFVIEGSLKNTIPFHLQLLESEDFLKGNLDTRILEDKILPEMVLKNK